MIMSCDKICNLLRFCHNSQQLPDTNYEPKERHLGNRWYIGGIMSQNQSSAPVTENKMGTMPVGKLLFNMSLPMIIHAGTGTL